TGEVQTSSVSPSESIENAVWRCGRAPQSGRVLRVGTFRFCRCSVFASRLKEEETLKRYLIAGAFVVASTLVAQTASAAEYYVVRDATTKKCTIVDTKPTTTTTTIVDNGTFKTRTEAESGMKTMKVCTQQ